jgi:hypothetical protein
METSRPTSRLLSHRCGSQDGADRAAADAWSSSQAGVSPTPVERPLIKGAPALRRASRVDRCSDSSIAALPGERSGAGGSAVAARAEMTWSRRRGAPGRRSAPRPRWPGRASRCRRRARTRCDPVVWHAQRRVSRRSRRQRSLPAPACRLTRIDGESDRSVTPLLRWARALGGLRTNLVGAPCSSRWSARVRRW